MREPFAEWLAGLVLVEQVRFDEGFTYIACPIKTDSPSELSMRLSFNLGAVDVMKQHGYTAYSPMVYWNTLADNYGSGWDAWWKVSFDMLDASSRMIVLCLPGWESSVGLADEMNRAATIHKPMFKFDPVGQ